eukprot:365719-Chlamydomonas_euryale.AAC.3
MRVPWRLCDWLCGLLGRCGGGGAGCSVNSALCGPLGQCEADEAPRLDAGALAALWSTVWNVGTV